MKWPVTILSVFLLLACIAGIELSLTTPPKGPHPVKQVIPKGFPRPLYDYKNNPLTREGIELGRMLFYDGRLSGDGQTACASCHQQFAAFADFEHVFSHGVNNRFTRRNAPPLFNLAWHKDFHLDGAINHIEVQPLAPFTGSNEMNTSIDSVIKKIGSDIAYRKMFRAAFATEEVTTQKMLKALAQFTGTIVSAGSKYDKVKNGQSVFSEWEQRGYDIFIQRCNGCHTEPLFTDRQYHNIGLAVDSFLNDYGRMVITGRSTDSLKFKTPTLRNVSRTAPYMHDGRYWGLSTAVNHWQTKAETSVQTDSLIVYTTPVDKMEVKYLLSFLYTLLDSSLLNDKRLADPIQGNQIHHPGLP